MVFHILRRCSALHWLSQNQRHCAKPYNVLTLLRVLHAGLFCENRRSLPANINVVHVHKRNASKKAKAKKKKGSGGSSGKLDLSVGSEVLDLKSVNDNMTSVTRRLTDEFQQKYSTRLSSATLDNVRVTVDGVRTPLYEMAEVRSVDKEFIITPMTGEDEENKVLLQAIQDSGLNLNPRLDGSLIRVPISLASSEYKESILKLAKASAEKSKVAIRKVRQQGMVEMKKHQNSTSKDTIRSVEKQIQLLTDAHNQEIENILSKKTLELNKT